jgi:hypothetical protein
MLTQGRVLGCLVVLAIVLAAVIGLLVLILLGFLPVPFVGTSGG